ncbi:DUF883 domain-containing protein [Paraglaciecola aquimarina]|uniref:DUF883 domain-containing protein n=1 Tax=Paraglaciecola aquimarina TaxID=1235557 RepID=A0ABU3SSI3_9ALTE|nr:DUF883 domain-containing protein [Paraglaciecola aquimarina]MDU0352981.1 DUF883 domain-containing protein [Paraglaciecola aquimarina]
MPTAAKTATKAKVTDSHSQTPIADRVTETLHESVNTLGEHATVAEGKLRETATTSAQNFEQKQQQAKQYWDQSSVGKFTKENPVATAGIAFAAGMLITSFFKRK